MFRAGIDRKSLKNGGRGEAEPVRWKRNIAECFSAGGRFAAFQFVARIRALIVLPWKLAGESGKTHPLRTRGTPTARAAIYLRSFFRAGATGQFLLRRESLSTCLSSALVARGAPSAGAACQHRPRTVGTYLDEHTRP